MVYFSIFYYSTARILFSCYCSAFDNLAALSSPAANERSFYFDLALGLGLLAFEKSPTILLVASNIILNIIKVRIVTP